MGVHHDPLLVALSVSVAICGGYTCFHLMDRLTRLLGTAWKVTLAMAGIAIGGGIWAMHFVAMSAMHLTGAIGYDLQQTLLSALIAIGMTTMALYVVTVRQPTLPVILGGGLLMGSGISGMHYVGMNAIRGGYDLAYAPVLVTVSVLVGIGASVMALHLAIHVRNRLKQIPAAIAMGVAIAGMHYTAMAATTFIADPNAGVSQFAATVVDQATMATMITGAAFLLFGSTFFLAAPGPGQPRRYEVPVPAAREVESGEVPSRRPVAASADQAGAVDVENRVRVPVQDGKRRTQLDAAEVACVHADAHYTKVSSPVGEFFCPLSISDMERRLHGAGFLRVHRSHLVNVRHVKAFDRHKDSGELIVLVGGKDRLVPVSRAKLEIVKHALDGWAQQAAKS